MLIKYDALSVEAMDKIHTCLDLLCDYGYVKRESTLKGTYDKVLNIYKLDRDSQDMWEMIWNHKINSLFQMEQQSGIQGIALSKPNNVNDLCVLNSVIRLMAPDKDSDTPLVMWSKYRTDLSGWIKEMEDFGLSEEEINWLSHHSAITDGICESQEGLMSLVQEERLGGNSLTFADKCRKGIAKKQGKLFQECEDIFYENIKKNNCSEKLAHYVWDVLLKVQRGYSFNRSHCLAYSLVALQEMNLAYHYPLIFWNCACLISDSGCIEEDGLTNYDKIAIAISKMQAEGINIGLPNINESKDIFVPDVENNRILYGLKAIGGINNDIIANIESNRPFTGIKDFMLRCPLTKTAMFNLIKAGAFDEVDDTFKTRKEIMAYYISQASEPKKKLNLQNFGGLIEKGIIPEELEMQIRVFNFNKYLKKRKYEEYYEFDESCANFFKRFYEDKIDLLEIRQNKVLIPQKSWDVIYQAEMDIARNWLKDNQEEALSAYNMTLFKDIWNKYANGTISKWEMDSLCFYYNEHELACVDNKKYGIVNFFDLNENSEVDYYFKRGGKQIPIFKLSRIAGTVLAKNDNHSSITLLTTTGVVEVKMSKDQYSKFKKQISQIGEDGKKHVIEKSWLARGRKIMITGYRRENQFVLKTYANTAGHQLYLIEEIIGDEMKIRHERMMPAGSLEEDEWEGYGA